MPVDMKKKRFLCNIILLALHQGTEFFLGDFRLPLMPRVEGYIHHPSVKRQFIGHSAPVEYRASSKQHLVRMVLIFFI